MRKIRAKKVKPQHIEQSVKETLLTPRVKVASLIALIVIIIAGIFIFMENTDSKIVITNKSDLKLEYLKAYYVGPDSKYNDGIDLSDIEAGKTIKIPVDPINLYKAEANIEIRFKFENHEEMLVDAGIFDDNFNGKVTINFTPSDDNKILMKVKAKSGVISSNLINCDEAYTINLNANEIED